MNKNCDDLRLFLNGISHLDGIIPRRRPIVADRGSYSAFTHRCKRGPEMRGLEKSREERAMTLPITLSTAAAAAFLHIWLSGRVVQARRGLNISVGDGGNEAVLRRMRAHANFAENIPIFLILLALAVTSLSGWVFGMRNNMINTLGEDYVTFAEANGLRSRTIALCPTGRAA